MKGDSEESDLTKDTSFKDFFGLPDVFACVARRVASELRDVPFPALVEALRDNINAGIVLEGVGNSVGYDLFRRIAGRDISITVLINMEMQVRRTERSLGYKLGHRILYYAGKGVAEQRLEKKDGKPDYSSLKPFYTVWIITVPPRHPLANSVIRLQYGETPDSFLPEDEKAQAFLDNVKECLGYSKIVLCFLSRKGGYAYGSDSLMDVLYALFSEKTQENVDRIASYGIDTDNEFIKREEKLMSYAESVEVIKQEGREEGWEDGWEDGLREGRESGLREGRENGLREGREEGWENAFIDMICKKVRKGKILERIADEMEESTDFVRPIYDAVRKAAPQYDMQEIRRILRAQQAG